MLFLEIFCIEIFCIWSKTQGGGNRSIIPPYGKGGYIPPYGKGGYIPPPCLAPLIEWYCHDNHSSSSTFFYTFAMLDITWADTPYKYAQCFSPRTMFLVSAPFKPHFEWNHFFLMLSVLYSNHKMFFWQK